MLRYRRLIYVDGTSRGLRGVVDFRFITAVWGDWHTSTFLTINLPSLLAAKNFPEVGRNTESIFDIYSTPTDARKIVNSEIFARVSKVIRTRVTEFGGEGGTGTIAQEGVWNVAADLAQSAGQVAVFLAPDMFWSNGAMAELVASFEHGAGAVYMTVLRATEETLAPVILAQPGYGLDGALSVDKEDLAKLAFVHLQPLHMVSQYGAPYQLFHHEHLFWMIPAEGFLVRTLAAHSLAIDQRIFKRNHRFSPDRVTASDPIEFAPANKAIFGVSLTPLFKDFDWYFDQKTYDDNFRGMWWKVFENPIHPRLANVPFRFSASDPVTPAWADAERSSTAVIRRSLLAKELDYLRYALRQDDRCSRSLFLIAVAVCSGLLNRLYGRNPLTLLVPVNSAFDVLPPWFSDVLVDPSGRRDLHSIIRSHIVPGLIDETHEILRKAGASVLGRIELDSGNLCYLIDRILFSERTDFDASRHRSAPVTVGG